MVKVATYSIPRNLFEVYKTDEENFVPYEPNTGEKEEDASSDDTSEKEEEEDEEEEEEEEENDEGFTLHQGEILETYYYGDFFDVQYDYDYEDISNNGSISVPSVDKKRFYKGVRTCLRKTWEEPGKTTNLEDLTPVLLGFITEQTYNENGVDLTLSGMTKLLDKKYQFEFTQMKMSKILEEMIKTAGLVPKVDFTGMLDEVIDYSNVSKSEDEGGEYDGAVSGDVAEMAKKVCKGKKGAEAKAEAIHHFIATHVQYPHPNYSDHKKCASEVLKSGISNCCDRANLGYQMANVVKLKARGVHGPNHVWVQYNIGGNWVDSDPGESRQHLHDGVYNGMSMDSLWDFKENGAC